MAGRTAIEVAREELADSDPKVRHRGLRRLAADRGSDAVRALIEVMHGDSSSEGMMHAAILLGETRSPLALEALLEAVRSHRDPSVRAGCTIGLDALWTSPHEGRGWTRSAPHWWAPCRTRILWLCAALAQPADRWSWNWRARDSRSCWTTLIGLFDRPPPARSSLWGSVASGCKRLLIACSQNRVVSLIAALVETGWSGRSPRFVRPYPRRRQKRRVALLLSPRRSID